MGVAQTLCPEAQMGEVEVPYDKPLRAIIPEVVEIDRRMVSSQRAFGYRPPCKVQMQLVNGSAWLQSLIPTWCMLLYYWWTGYRAATIKELASFISSRPELCDRRRIIAFGTKFRRGWRHSSYPLYSDFLLTLMNREQAAGDNCGCQLWILFVRRKLA